MSKNSSSGDSIQIKEVELSLGSVQKTTEPQIGPSIQSEASEVFGWQYPVNTCQEICAANKFLIFFIWQKKNLNPNRKAHELVSYRKHVCLQ